MNNQELYELKDKLEDLCIRVGQYQMDNLGRRDLIIDSKSSAVDLVTEVDKKSEELIIDFINRTYTNHSILAEESGSTETQSDYLWIIDPVDGTTNYAHGYPMFAISIGLKYKEDMILGCIYMPALKEFYWAIKGQGAFVNDKPIRVSDALTLEQSIVATGFPYNKKTSPDNNLDYFGRIMPLLGGVRRSGSACVDLVSVACGRIDGYFEMYLNPWDFLPGQLIVHEAGGLVETRLVRGRYSIVATNNKIHKELRREIAAVKTSDY